MRATGVGGGALSCRGGHGHDVFDWEREVVLPWLSGGYANCARW